MSFNGGMSSYRSVPITSSGSFTGLQASALPFHSVDLAPPALTASVSALNVGTTDPVSLQVRCVARVTDACRSACAVRHLWAEVFCAFFLPAAAARQI